MEVGTKEWGDHFVKICEELNDKCNTHIQSYGQNLQQVKDEAVVNCFYNMFSYFGY